MSVIFSILFAILTTFSSHSTFASESSSSKETNIKSDCNRLLENKILIPPLYKRLETLTFSEAVEINASAVDSALSLKIYFGNQETANPKDNIVKLKELYKSLRISQRKFLEFKNTVFEAFVLKKNPSDIDHIGLLQRDLEYWLDHLSEKYLRELMSSLNAYIQTSDMTSSNESRVYEVTTPPYRTSNPEMLNWLQRNWVIFSYYDQELDLWFEFLTVGAIDNPSDYTNEQQRYLGKTGLLYLEDILKLIQETQIAMDNIKQMSQHLAQYPEYIKNLDSKTKAELTEELFVTAGVSHERLGQILDKVLGSSSSDNSTR